MNKPASVLVPLLLGITACTPGAPPAPASAPTPAPTPVTRPAVETPAPVALDSAPVAWWLQDEASARVRGIGVERAYRELLAGREPKRTVVVAVVDSGVDPEHEDLDDNLWVNSDEIAGNRKDDDRNGYVDDVHGWNFLGGRDGRHVEHDTYEVTRLYAALRPRYEAARPDTLRGDARAEYGRFLEVRRAYREQRAQTEEQLRQVRMIDAVMTDVEAVLAGHLGTRELTRARVAAIQTLRPDLARAQQLYLRLADDGITREEIAEALEALGSQAEYGLNLDFDPRPIVGDDYADATERGYGNPDVEGPSADHGTHVAGIIAAERGNGLGVDGIAPAVRIMALRAVPDGDERDKDVANAIRYAADNGAQIINMSFGKAFSPRKDVVDAAVRYATEKGVLLVHAAGNDAADLAAEPSFPTRTYLDGGESDLWIEVGASSWKGTGELAAPFSNYGMRHVDVFAPGVDIRSTVPGNEYDANSGTSMAAPVVSGVAALLMAYYPELSAREVRDIILRSATSFAEESTLLPGTESDRRRFGDLSATGGVVNAYEAVRLAEERVRSR